MSWYRGNAESQSASATGMKRMNEATMTARLAFASLAPMATIPAAMQRYWS